MRLRILSAFFLLAFIFFGCKTNENHNHENGPEIYIISPSNLDSLTSGSLIEINAIVADNKEVHDVTINITSNNSTTKHNKMFFDHIHNTVFDIDTSFIANIPNGSTANYKVEILAKDMSGNLSSQSITVHVMDTIFN